MTRWARNKSAQKHGKLPSEPTPWTELRASIAAKNTKQTTVSTPKSKRLPKNVNSFTVTPIEHREILIPVSRPIANVQLLKKPKSKRKRLTKEDKTQIHPLEKLIPEASDDTNDFQLTEKLKTKGGKLIKEEAKRVELGTEEEKLLRIKKKEKYREIMIKKRNDRGIQLLSPKIERKIYNTKKGMRRKGLSGDKIKEEIRKIRRTEELRLRKNNDKLCLRCRQPGHKVADCREITGDVEQSMGVCFKCGSTEHKLSQCTSKSQSLPFAKCFICAGLGHLSSNCPKNPRGKYPKGGSCKVCGSVNHFANDCPQDKRFKEDEVAVSVTLPGESADFEEGDEELEDREIGQKNNKKTVSF